MSIFSLSNILVNCQKKKQINKLQTSTHTSKRLYFYFKYLRKLQSAKSFSTSQKITINKAFLYIPEDHDRPTPVKAKTIRKEKEKMKEKEKEKRDEKEKRGKERYNGGSGT